jgi:methionine-rich copper-binding protein CopC
MKRTVRSAFSYAAALILASVAFAACGELTGPESPSTPTDVKATLLSPTSVKVTWTPSPLNDGVISYSIFRNGNKVAESTTTEYTDTGLAQQTTYVYSVAANCKGGIVSDRSAETTQSTVTTVDLTPPTVIANQPPNNFNGASSAATVTATFSEPMDPNTINATTFTLRVTGGAAIAGTVSYNATTRVATFVPTGGSMPNPANITATITTGAKDLAGNALATAFSWTFITRDDTPPTVTSTGPANGATGVSPSAPITITFSEAMDANTITTANITMRTTIGGTAVNGTIAYSAATRTATFTPSATLAQTTGYTVTVSTGVKDAAGNAMAANFVFAFTTGDTTAPTVTTVVPANNATGVALNTTVKVTFSEAMDQSTITTSTVTLRNTATSGLVTATLAYDGATNTATLTPSAPLASNTNYTVTVTTGAKDVSGNPLGTNFTSTFTTLNLDSTPPTVTAVSPLNNSINVPTNTTVQVTFSEPIDQLTLTATTVSLKNTVTSAVVAGSLSYDVGTNKVTFTPSGPLSNGTSYTLTVLGGASGVKDLAGNPLAANFTSSFTTAAVTDVTPPTIVSRTPTNGATGVAVNSNVTITFSEPMDATTINGTTISIKPTAGGANLAATVTCNSPCTVATLDPTADLSNNTNYTVTVTTGVKDAAGNALAAQSTSTFTTIADTTAPTIIATSPTNGATNVPVGTAVTVTFSEDMDPLTINATTFTLKTTVGSVAVAGVVSYNAATRVATFTPSANLAANTNYTATVTTGAKDTAGNALAVNASFSFTTAP